MAIADRIDFVVIAGDIYDGDWKSADTGYFVRRQLIRLSAAGIPVFAVAGNHDALSVVSRSFRWPDGAHHFGGVADSREVPGLNVVIHGRSFGDRHESRDFVESYPPTRPGLFNVGLLHTSLGGAAGHAEYAPCSPAQLAARGYDYWALGHVHVPRVVQDGPHVVYAGNIQGRGVDETGPRGCFVVTVDESRRAEPHFVSLDDVRWERIAVAVDAGDSRTVDQVVGAVIDAVAAALPGDDALLACRVVLTGTTPLHRRLVSRRGSLRADVAAAIDGQLHNRVWLEQIAVETADPEAAPRPPDGVPPRALDLLEDEFTRLRDSDIDTLLAEHPDLRGLFDALQPLDQVRQGRRDELMSREAWRRTVDDARALLAAELCGHDDPAERAT
jgi:DNA repair exonuclease SbcCD nuclease subunit